MQEPTSEKRYLDDPYAAEFRATIRTHEPGSAPGQHRLRLDRNFFYPESGGQLPDRGRVGDFDVVDVQEAGGDSVVVTVSGEGEPPTGEVECRVDWDTRFDHMQQHTGQHVLSRAFIEVGGLPTVSFHMGEDACTIDLEGSGFSDDVARGAEDIANRIVRENREVVVRTVHVDDIDEDALRGKVPGGVTDARLVEVRDFDVIPCCGTHVARTGELGLIKVLRWEKAKGLHRVAFKVGGRALDDYRHKHDVVADLASRFTTGTAEVVAKVEKLVAENQARKKEAKQLAQRLAGYEVERLAAGADVVGDARLVACRLDGDGGFARLVSSGLKDMERMIAVVGASDGSVVCSASDDAGVDVAAAALARAKVAGASGGGKGSFAQIKLPDGSGVEEFVHAVASDIRALL